MSLLPEESARTVGSSGLVVAMVGEAALPGSGEAVAAGGADGGAVASVLLVGGDVADAGVKPHRVVVLPADLEFGAEHVDVFEELEVRVLGLEVPEQRLDPGLVGWGAGPAEVGGEPAQRHELPGRSRAHLWPVVRHHQQHRHLVVVGVPGGAVGVAVLDLVVEALGAQRTVEHGLYLDAGLVGRGDVRDPLAGDHIGDDRGRRARPSPVRRVVDPDPVRGLLHPFRPRPTRRAAFPLRGTKTQVTAFQDPSDRRRVGPEPAQPRPPMRELAVRPVNLGPLVEHRDDLVLLQGCEAMDRVPARWLVVETVAGGRPAPPPLQSTLGQLEVTARVPCRPATLDRAVDHADQRDLGGRVDPPWDPATQSQGSFPSARVSRTAISANAVRSRSTSAWAASSSKSRCLSRRPGRDWANASSAPCRATSRSLAMVDRSTRTRSAASPTVVSPRTSCIQISYFSCGARNRFLFMPGWVLNRPSSGSAENPLMPADSNPDQRHEVSPTTGSCGRAAI